MKHIRKRIVSLGAAAAMTFSALPLHTPLLLRPALTASAGDSANPASEFEYTNIGDGIQIKKWNGSGETVVVPSEINGLPVNEISGSAFKDQALLTKITLPDTVAAIGQNAFDGCLSLQEINIPDGVTSIEFRTFSHCSALKTLTIPESVTSIGRNAFAASGLTSVTLPKGLTTIDVYAFSSCSALKSVVIPEGVTDIYDFAFIDCSALASVTLPKNLERIGVSAFAYCSALKSITIPDGTKRIDSEAFAHAGLTDITIPASVTDIDADAIERFTGITIHGYAGSYAEEFAAKDEYWTFEAIEDTAANIVESGTCGENLTWTLDDAGILTITGEGEMESHIYGDAPWADYSDSIKKVVIGEGITILNGGHFENCKALTEVSLPDSLIWIRESTFRGCSALTEITLPEKVSLLGGNVFRDCISLKSITFVNPHAMANRIGDYAFENCSALTSFAYPDATALNKIGSEFRGCTGLTDITILRNVKQISDKAFQDCENLTIHGYYNSYAEEFAKEHGIPFQAVDEELSGTLEGGLTWKLDSERTLTVSGKGAMHDFGYSENAPWHESCASIKKIVVEDGVTTIGMRAFEYCEAAESVTVPDGLTSIGASAFDGCKEMKAFHIPEGVTEIGSSAFGSCESLTEITVPDSISAIDGLHGGVFGNCINLKKVTLPDHLSSIPYRCFFHCALTEITIPSEAQYIGEAAFSRCNLTEISIPAKVNSIGADAFSACPLTTVTVPETVLRIDNGAFDTTSLTDITILNDNCAIYKDRSVFGNAVIHGYAGSTAEEYADAYGRKFEVIAPQKPLAGDCSGDGSITVADAVLLARFVSEDQTLSAEQLSGILAAETDLDGDGLITVSDVAAVLNIAKEG